jgi:hypothetical protein
LDLHRVDEREQEKKESGVKPAALQILDTRDEAGSYQFRADPWFACRHFVTADVPLTTDCG